MTTTPAPRDERELFESAYLKEYFYPAERWSLVPEKYRTEHADISWRAWRARSALAESELAEVREQLRIREEERAEQWRLRRDVDGDLITSQAVVAELRAELELVRAMRDALTKIIEMNRQHSQDQYGDPNKAETWACVTIARAAIDAARGVGA